MPKADPQELPLTVACQRVGLGYMAGRDAVLRGQLNGELRQGRWIVRADAALAALVRSRREHAPESTDLPPAA